MKKGKTAAVALLAILWTCRAFVSSQDVLAFFNQDLTPDQSAAAKIVPTATEYQVFYPQAQPHRTVREAETDSEQVRRSSSCAE